MISTRGKRGGFKGKGPMAGGRGSRPNATPITCDEVYRDQAAGKAHFEDGNVSGKGLAAAAKAQLKEPRV